MIAINMDKCSATKHFEEEVQGEPRGWKEFLKYLKG